MKMWHHLAIVFGILLIIGLGVTYAIYATNKPLALAPAANPTTAAATSGADATRSNKAPPVPTATAMPEGSWESENAKLRKENERLRAAVQQRSPQASLPRAGKTYQVNGSAWVVRNNATSDLLRGLQVHLLSSEAPVGAVAASLEQSRKDAKASAERWAQSAAENRAKAAAEPYGRLKTMYMEFAGEDQAGERKSLAVVAAIEAASANLKPGVDLARSYGLLQALDEDGVARFAPVARATSQAQAVTNADGKFSLSNVTPGRHYLYAIFSSEVMVMEWLQPIEVVDSDVTVDLYNDNAVRIWNKRP
jgi:hypothetical protein